MDQHINDQYREGGSQCGAGNNEQITHSSSIDHLNGRQCPCRDAGNNNSDAEPANGLAYNLQHRQSVITYARCRWRIEFRCVIRVRQAPAREIAEQGQEVGRSPTLRWISAKAPKEK